MNQVAKLFPIIFASLAIAAGCSGTVDEYDEAYTARYYDKSEHMIPMRDGVRLATSVYSPKDQSQEYPILFFRTPYSIEAYGDQFRRADMLAPELGMMKEGYIFVFQDIRGTYMSEGEFVPSRPVTHITDPTSVDESTDNYDTIDWLVKNVENFNGRVGQWGISYSGFTTTMGLIDPHPALAAASPQASPADQFVGDDGFHNGAFRLMYAFSWMRHTARRRDGPTDTKQKPFDYGTPSGYEFFLGAGPTNEMNDRYFGGTVPAFEDYSKHAVYDKFWQDRNLLNHLHRVDIPVLNVAAWFDAEDFYGPISIYQELESYAEHNQNSLVVGPWWHAGWFFDDGESLGDISFGSKTGDYYRENIVRKFFDFHLKDKGTWNPSEAIVFETGGNQWHRFDQWPPASITPTPMYLESTGSLSFARPDNVDSQDRYLSNPNKPIPFSSEIRTSAGHTWMIEDQRSNSTRPDVLTYRTEPLKEDLTIAGPILANLFVSSSGTDADFFVKLIDVFPGDLDAKSPRDEAPMGGYQMLLGVQVMRAKFRDDLSNPEPLVPGEVAELSFNIWDKFHTFKKGHSIMVQVHSSWFPAYDRNPQKFMNIFEAGEGDYQEEWQSIKRSSAHPSHLILPILQLQPPARSN